MSENIQAFEDANYHNKVFKIPKGSNFFWSESQWITSNTCYSYGAQLPKVVWKESAQSFDSSCKHEYGGFCFVFLKKWDHFCSSFYLKWRFTWTSSTNTLFSPAFCCSVQVADFSRGLKIKIYINLQLTLLSSLGHKWSFIKASGWYDSAHILQNHLALWRDLISLSVRVIDNQNPHNLKGDSDRIWQSIMTDLVS